MSERGGMNVVGMPIGTDGYVLESAMDSRNRWGGTTRVDAAACVRHAISMCE